MCPPAPARGPSIVCRSLFFPDDPQAGSEAVDRTLNRTTRSTRPTDSYGSSPARVPFVCGPSSKLDGQQLVSDSESIHTTARGRIPRRP